MSLFDDMRAETADAPSASDFLVRSETATADYGVAQVDSAKALGAMQTLGTDLGAASNMAQSLAAGAVVSRGAVHAFRSVNEEGSRAAAVALSVASGTGRSIVEWLKQRPEAAWRFLKQETAPAWDAADEASEASDPSSVDEGSADIAEGAKALVGMPLGIDRKRGDLNDAAANRLARWDNKAVRQQKKADRIVGKLADKADSGKPGRRSSFAKFRQRYHQSKAERLRGEGTGALGGVLKARRKKNEAQVSVSRRKFLLIAAGGIVLVPLALGMVSSCSAGVVGGVASAVGASSSQQGGSLNAVESQVAAFLLGKGLDALHAAAIMGNMFGESEMNPSLIELGGTGIGICQWSYSRADDLRSYAQSRGTDWTDLATQLDFLWEHDSRKYIGNWSSSYTIVDSRVNDHPGDPAVGTRVSGSKSGFEATDDIDQAVEEYCYGWESPGVPRLAVRKEAARRYLTALSSTVVVSGSAQAVINAAMSQLGVPYVFGGDQPGVALDCSGLTQYAYSAAGIQLPHQSQAQKDTCLAMGGSLVPSIAEARPGDLFVWYGVAGAGYGSSGHVAIYLGNNQIIEAAGYGVGVVISTAYTPTWICRFPSLS